MRTIFTCILTLMLSTIFAQNRTLILQIENIKSINGNIMIAGFKSQKDFNNKENSAFEKIAAVSDTIIKVKFENVKDDKYAIAIFHDQNKDKQLNVSKIGIPTEGYGFSGDYNSIFKIPKFNDCSFNLNSDTLIKIKMIYW